MIETNSGAVIFIEDSPTPAGNAEAGRILSAWRNFKHRMLLTTACGCGLRVSEVVALRVRGIDGERHLLRVEQGKGGKDRNVIVPPTLLTALRDHWPAIRPTHWRFPGRDDPVLGNIGDIPQISHVEPAWGCPWSTAPSRRTTA